jgi:hypothetical protein|tara:strand:- start:352 stop:600 length:249 start_codon:yes stop_codon:yes gene_type:complete
MGVPQVLKALHKLALGRHASAFERCEINGPMCDLLDEELLQQQLGVIDPAERRRFLAWVARMQTGKERAGEHPPPAAAPDVD